MLKYFRKLGGLMIWSLVVHFSREKDGWWSWYVAKCSWI